MKLVLVAGMNPRVKQTGPRVKLFEGWYKLCVENHKDCKMVLHIGPFGRDLEVTNGSEFNIYPNETAQLELLSGSEDFINVFAEVINGPVSATTT